MALDFPSQTAGNTGFGAVQNLGGATPMPPELMRHIAMARASMNQNPQYPTDAIEKNSDMRGLTPQALEAFRALMARNLGPSANPEADTRLRQSVDLGYGLK